MKTYLLANRRLACFDNLLVTKLELRPVPEMDLRRQEILIGICNEDRCIYRVIGVDWRREFLKIAGFLHGMGMVNLLEDAREGVVGFDAVFYSRVVCSQGRSRIFS